MKKLLLSLVFTAVSTFSFGQIKSTGPVALGSSFGLQIDLNSATNTATFSFAGPSSGWMGVGLDAAAMASGGKDCIQVGTSIADRRLSGSRSLPITDVTNNLTLVSNNVNPNNGVRTVILTRPLNTADANDYTFDYATITSLPIIYALGNSTDFTTSGHTSYGSQTLTFTTLGIDGHEIKAFSIYPNPTFDSFKIQTEAQINGVVIYDNVGKMVQKFEQATDKYDISKLSKGVYFLEINTVAGQKSYEKIVKE